jgi:uncharacterized Zn-binding protein involved in type VI secretion
MVPVVPSFTFMPPASRIGDNHTCPMVNPGPVPHVGGPILTGMSTVLIGNKPAARVGDKAMCQAPPDTISMGATNVLIGNKMAARIGDPTQHGGVVVQGLPTVLIGTHPQGAVLKAAAKSGVAFCEECARRKAEAQREKQRQANLRKPPTAAAHKSATPATSAMPTAGRAVHVDRAVTHLSTNAHAKSQGRCLRSVREALEAGGARPGRTLSAKDYGPNLERAGFTAVANQTSAGYAPQRGDVVVFAAVAGHRNGHIAMYDGGQWVSDYRQRSFYANEAYRRGTFSVYRP